MNVTTFSDYSALTKTERTFTWAELIDHIRTAGPFPNKKACPWVKLATFGGKRTAQYSLRHNDNVQEIHGIEGDYDDEVMTPEEAVAKLEAAQIRAIVYTSPSHTPEKPRWRVLCPLATVASPEQRTALVARLNGALGGVLASESFTLSQAYYYGSTGEHYRVLVTFDDPDDGTCVDDLDELDNIAIGKPTTSTPAPDGTPSDALHAFRVTVAKLGRKLRTCDGRRELLKSYVASRSAVGNRGADLVTLVHGIAAQFFDPADPFDEKDVQGLVRWASGRDNKAAEDASRLAAGLAGAISAAPGTKNPYVLRHVSDLLTPKQVQFVIEGVIEVETLVMLFGPPKHGKSFISLDWACSVATGTPWCGRETQQGSVFYLAGEGHAGIGRRLTAWQLHHGHDLSKAPLFFSEKAPVMTTKEGAKLVGNAIFEMAKIHGKPSLIVIDTLARSFGVANENDTAAMNEFVVAVDEFKSYFKCAMTVVHHSGHGASDRARGSSSLPGAVDASFSVEKKGDNTICLSQPLAKDSAEIDPIHFEMKSLDLPGWVDQHGTVLTSLVLVPQEPGTAPERSKPLSPALHAAKNSFIDAAGKHGELDDAGQFVGLHVDLWRPEFYRVSACENAEAKKVAFQRARKELIKAQKLTVNDDVYSLAGDLVGFENQAIAMQIIANQTKRNTEQERNKSGTCSGGKAEVTGTERNTPLKGCSGVPSDAAYLGLTYEEASNGY